MVEINAHLIIKNTLVLTCIAWRPWDSIRRIQKHPARVHISWRWLQTTDFNDSSLHEAGFTWSSLALLFPFIFNYCLIFHKIDTQSNLDFKLLLHYQNILKTTESYLDISSQIVHSADLSSGSTSLLSLI